MDLTRINKVSLKVKNIGVGDTIQVGEKAFLRIDKIPEEILQAFDTIKQGATKQIDNPHNTEILKQQKIPMSQFLFTHLMGFARHIAEGFPDLKDTNYMGTRTELYHKKGTVNFSELFDNKSFQCAEYAVMAQLYLQSIGVDSEYVGGEFINTPVAEFGDQHSFVIIHEKDKDYIFDPANEIKLSTTLANISLIELNPKQKLKIQGILTGKGRKVAFFETTNLITKNKMYYGYGDSCNILPEMVFQKEPDNTIIINNNGIER